ncbi:MAG: 4Fe-4S dicluster domain-containing protein, partial [Thiohalocapsa sp.]|uniref:4Fe-4S dicluster domain-containing protein n=1 Tax=Thiohalocapsa sp. TaxID=2497641 RepID=UPI0025F89A41
KARWYHPRPAGEVEALTAAKAAFGTPLLPRLHLDRAAVVLSLDADPLGPGPDQVAYARDFAAARGPEPGADGERFLRLYAVEPTPSLTGAMADHRLALRWQQVEGVARRVARRLGLDVAAPAGDGGVPAEWIATLVDDLRRHGANALVLAGERQPEPVHRLACAINAHLGAVDTTVSYLPPAAFTAEPHAGGLDALARDLGAGDVELLVILDANPVYDAPADLDFDDAMAMAARSVHLGAYVDETAAVADWHVPAAHPLEAWGDLCAPDGTATIVQPLIAPLYGGRTAGELLDAVVNENGPRTPYELVRGHWQQQLGADGFEQAWQQSLRDGYLTDTRLPARQVQLDPAWQDGIRDQALEAPQGAAAGLDLVFRPDATVRDGRFANNAWLQELPKPFTKLTWDNAALIAPQTAARLGLIDGDVVEIRHGDQRLTAPVWRLPGQALDTLTLPLGYGRRQAGRFGSGIGFDANALRTTWAPWLASGAELHPTGRRAELATTQHHQRMEGHDPLRTATLASYREAGGMLVQQQPALPSLYVPWPRGEHAWGMSIDLNACIGCGVCTIACQAENNIPSVGKAQVQRGREMHWIRVDRYFAGPPEQPRILFQPVPCMHCENAPCEIVCPVGATLHDSEGLNLQVYNRCVGTRFCSNNCPYKVRRFNFLDYTGHWTEAQRNPQVTVRMRGVMEKCSYCLQRINAARIDAQTSGRALRDGDVVTACQGACPTRAIVFGDLNLEGSEVAQAQASGRSYQLLQELGTRPRTTYRVRLSNPNPRLEPGADDGAGEAS